MIISRRQTDFNSTFTFYIPLSLHRHWPNTPELEGLLEAGLAVGLPAELGPARQEVDREVEAAVDDEQQVRHLEQAGHHLNSVNKKVNIL